MAIDLDVHGNTQPLEAAVQAAVNRIRRTPIKITVDDRGATQPLGNMKRGADEFTKSMEAANARILAFGASMAIINGVADSFKAMVRNMVEVEKAMADINVVMGLSSQSLEKFGDGLFKVAKETGAAFNIAAQAATEYARQGLAVEESLKRTRDALILTRLTGMDSAEAVKSLTAAMNTYGNQIKDTTQLVSKFAAVDVQFAVSAEDFAQAISRTGAAAKGAGVDIDELIGIVTAAQQQTARGGAVIGNSLKTIFTRIGRVDTLNQLESLGIAVRDVEGNTIGAKRILTDLANTFDKLGEAQKSQIAQTVGGVFQINILKAILGDAAKQNGILARATQISSSATDEAIDKNEQLRNTMAAMATETGLSLKQLSAQIGELMLAPGVEKILNTVKSLSEGISGALGDGESIGGKFGKGFLTGIGNIITGPGLVVVFAVLGKLAAQAFKFTKESLTSLVGVTSESQKQKAIQTSLVTLFGQNAALNKEILRTDISRTEKEKIILGLLQAQTVEANKLNAISKQLASTLYSRGYGPNLTKGKSRAYGHIPNFAHPEREQAAKGGYAAGTIRSINMPGEGSVIYNSAEKVKNFKGMSQPAIMPPQSSKAGKNYQQAFGSIHGFDPYAAGGYIPNFNKSSLKGFYEKGLINPAQIARLKSGNHVNIDGKRYEAEDFGKETVLGFTSHLKTKDKQPTKSAPASGLANTPINLNKILLTGSRIRDMGVLLGYGSEGRAKKVKYRQSFGSLPESARKHLLPYMGPKGLRKMPKQDSSHWKRDVEVTLPTKAVYAVSEDDAQGMEEAVGADTLQAALKRSIGSGFDKFSSKIGQKLFGSKSKGTNVLEKHVLSDGSALGALFEAGVRGALNNEALTGTQQQRAFDFMGDNARRLSDKFMGIGKRNYIEAKKDLGAASRGDIPKKVLNAAAAAFIGPMKPGAAGGYIPNFADPLSDAIGREKAAGVPVSQIRVGSHGALMGKGNPLGLGVTNTHDEPNGLRDVFGANGFVPNYAQEFSAADIHKDAGIRKERKALAKKINEQIQSIDASIYSEEDYRREIDEIIKKQKKNGKSIELSKSGQDKANQISKRNTQEIQKNTTTKQSNTVASQANTVASQANTVQTAANTAKRKTLGAKLVGGIKNMNQGMGGMGLMMGLPMLAGFIPGADKPGSAGGMASGMLSGAATGASIGMMFPGWGTAIGAAIGVLGGFVSSIKQSTNAIQEESIQRAKSIANMFPAAQIGEKLSGPSGFGTQAVNKFLGGNDLAMNFKTVEELLKMQVPEINKQKNVYTTLNEDLTRNAQGAMIGGGGSGDLFTPIDEGHTPPSEETLKSLSEYNDYIKQILPKQKAAIVKLISSMGPGLEMLPSVTENKEGKMVLSDKLEAMTFKKFGKEIGDAALFEGEQGIQNLQAVLALLIKIIDESKVNTEKMNEAIILRLNKEKTLLSAQDTFNQAMNTSAVFSQMMAEEYQFKMATMSAYMSEEEIASAKLSEAKRVAADKYIKSIKGSEQQARESLINLLQGDQYKQSFKDYLQEGGISEEDFGAKSLSELQEAAKEISLFVKGGSTSMGETIDNQNEKLRIQKEEYKGIEDLAESRAELEKRITDELIRQQTGPGAFSRGMQKGFADMDKQVARMDYELGQKIPFAFADGMASAMTEAINGTKDLKDALSDAAMGFLGMIQQAMMQSLAYRLVGGMGFAMPGMMSRGGNVRNYSRGGGVPARVSDGEYVMGRDAVNKYGGSFMHGLNAGGRIPGFSDGGSVERDLIDQGVIKRESDYSGTGAKGSALAANFGGGRGFKSGRQYQRRAMSSFFYKQSGNVGLEEDVGAMGSILQEEESRRQEAERKRQEKKAKRRQLIGMLISTAAMAGISHLMGPAAATSGGLSGASASGPVAGLNADVAKLGFDPYSSSTAFVNSPINAKTYDFSMPLLGQYLGGPIRKYASGGYISGKSGIDQIPAMLSEGEYVIRASSARQIGKPMLDRINAGKFNEGGPVTEMEGSQESSNTGSGNTNNINISINLEKGSSKEDASKNQNQEGDRSNEQMKEFSDKIKKQVLSVIVEEQRPGGLLQDTK